MDNNGDGIPFLRFWREIGIGAPSLRIHRAQLRAFTEADWRELRDDYQGGDDSRVAPARGRRHGGSRRAD
jgi:hypothetical protein